MKLWGEYAYYYNNYFESGTTQRQKETSIAKVYAFVAALETGFSNNEINGSEATMKSFMAHSDEVMNDLDKQYFDKHISNPTFAFWKQYIDMVSTLLLFINMKAQFINEQFEVIVSDCDDFLGEYELDKYGSTSKEKQYIQVHALSI